MAHSLRLDLDLFRQILGLPPHVDVVGVERIDEETCAIHLRGLQFEPGATIIGMQFYHYCEGETWYRTEIRLPSPLEGAE